MEFPNGYIKRRGPDEEPFILHSGKRTRVLYDVNAMLMDPSCRRDILRFVYDSGERHFVGIPTGGAIIAVAAADAYRGVRCSIVKDGELKGPVPEGSYLLIDDVVTTGCSLSEAFDVLEGHGIGDGARIVAVVDRRPRGDRKVNVTALFDVGDEDD